MANSWYAYVGGSAGDPTLARNYTRIAGSPGCVNGPFVCAIYAPSGGINPTPPLSANILTYIANGLSNLVAEPQLPVGSKLFVYMKAGA